jgi:uncharacterized membrane protein
VKLLLLWNKYYIVALFYVLLSLIIGSILNNGLIIFLGWNMILATIVLFLSQVLSIVKNKGKYLILEYAISILWILFFPNALYITSDFIHFQNYTFFEVYPNVYSFELSPWLVFTHILLGAILAAKMGVISLNQMIKLWKNKLSKPQIFLLVNLLFLLASLGIYIGRFMRFNSWQFYKIFSILNEIVNNFSFILGFVIMFFIIHWAFYMLFKSNQVIEIE